jgi:hypothetical protein
MLTTQDVRDYLADSKENNHLLDDIEFTDSRINLAMKMALSEFNAIPPKSTFQLVDFPYMATLLDGTCYHIYRGQMALAARNTMSYSDGGLDIPIEERFPYYAQMMQFYGDSFKASAKAEKIQLNMESGWDSVSSDYATFPVW